MKRKGGRNKGSVRADDRGPVPLLADFSNRSSSWGGSPLESPLRLPFAHAILFSLFLLFFALFFGGFFKRREKSIRGPRIRSLILVRFLLGPVKSELLLSYLGR